MTLKRIDLVHQLDKWVATAGNRVVVSADTKERAIRETADAARQMKEGCSVRIHTRDGRIQEERTYPRGADPRGSKG